MRRKGKHLFSLFLLSVITVVAIAQTNYSPLYTSANFVKTIDLSRPVGTVAGSAGTTPSGGVTYTFPVYTPPGTNGIEPSISIVYNSQGGNGIAGFGWNISGLSAISRTGKNLYHNGEVAPVNYTGINDAFLLDGVRLNPIVGQNGENLTVYRTESETFSTIVSHTSSSNNPYRFLVTTKDGTNMEFGYTADSRLMTDDGMNVMLWRLNRIIDINGNYIDFKYDNTGRDSRIDEINYTGNTVTGLLPYNKIKFNYGGRYDQNTGYEGGASVSSGYLLNNISIANTDDEGELMYVVKKYQFNYGYDNMYSLLKEVEEYGEGLMAPPLLNSTIFLYGDPSQNSTIQATVSTNGEIITGDFNADGKTDILSSSYYYDQGIKYTSGYKIYLDPLSSNYLYEKTFPSGHLIPEKKTFVNFLSSDYNKDGRDDVLHVKTKIVTYPSGNTERQVEQFTIEYSTASGSIMTYLPMPGANIIHSSGNFFIPGDFDGDGNQDYISVLRNSSSNWWYGYICMPAKIFANYQISSFTVTPGTDWSATSIASADYILPIDFDGDSKQEILVVKGSQTYLLGITEAGAGSYSASIILTTSEIAAGYKIFPGDFNGDRKNDLLVRESNGNWKIMTGTGTNFITSFFTFSQAVNIQNQYNDDKIVIGDFNGDGKSDILHGFEIWSGGYFLNTKFSVYFSKGVAFYNELYDYAQPLPFSYSFLPSGDFNGDGRSDILLKPSYGFWADIYYFRPNGKEKLLHKVTDGHNNTVAFEYKLLTDKTSTPYVYNRTVSLDNPVNLNPFNYVQLPLYVVSSMTVPDGIGGLNLSSFFYEDAVIHRYAKGFLEFKKITAIDNIANRTSITENEINTQFATPYTIKQTSRVTAPSILLSESLITNSFINLSTGSNDIRYFQKVDKTLSIDNLNGTAAESVNTFDNYGNVVTNISKVGVLSGTTVNPTETTTTTTVYGIHNTPVPAKPDNVTVSNIRTGMTAVSASTAYTYTANGNIAAQTAFSGLPKAVTTSYTYNSFGNILQTVTSSPGLSNRTTAATYDIRGRYPLTKSTVGSAVTPTEYFTYDGKWGKPLSAKTIDCMTTTFEYDEFGRLKKTNLPEGYSVNHSLVWNVQGQQLFYEFTDYPGGNPDTKLWKDKLGREIKSQVAGFNNQWLTVLSTYNNRGLLITKTNAYYPSETPLTTTTDYDGYNRPSSVTNVLNQITTTYTPLTGTGQLQVTTQNSAGQTQSKITDAAGKVITAIDNGGQLDYTYDSRGNQTDVKHGTTVLVTTTYDVYGRQISLTDKNAGTVNYDYDAYGQLLQQTDNLNNSYTMTYDDLGRITDRRGPEGITTYEYHAPIPAPDGLCSYQLKKETGPNGVILEYNYDNLGRLQTETKTIDGLPLTTLYIYDIYGSLTHTTYPSGVVVNRTYDINGGLLIVSGGDYWNPVSLFTANDVNGFGQYTDYTLGNGRTSQNTYHYGIPTRLYTQGIQDLNLSFDYIRGNLWSRTDQIKGMAESFQYDNLNRLASSTVNGVQQLSINYDAASGISMGNIVSKTDAGNYVYSNNRIHAVNYITNPAGPTAPPITISPALQTISYTPFLKTASITEGNVQSNFTYGPDYQRAKMENYISGNLSSTKYYYGGFERVLDNNYREIIYVSAGNGLCAIIEKYINSGSNIHFVYSDYLGSPLTITDINGAIEAEQNFDAWGRNRNPNTWQYAGTGNTPAFFDRGYTGHEHLQNFALINMNGRMYDPIQGRMLSPDNYVPNPWHTQGYNRYSYANNNPLSYTDPDGNFIHLLIGGLIGGVVNLVSSAIQGNIHSWGDGFKAFGIGALQGAIGAAIGYGGFGSGAWAAAKEASFHTAKSILGNIAVGIGSSFIPSIPFGDNFSVSPSFAFGSHGLSSGLSARLRSGNFSVGIGFNNSSGNAGWSAGIGWDDGKTGFSYSFNHFSGIRTQNTGTIGFRFGNVSGSWENDRFAGNYDRWRTNGMGLGYTFKNGSRAFIGSRFMTGQDDGGEYSANRPIYNEIEGLNAPREGLFYASFYNRNGIGASVGVDWEHGMHQMQNGMHDLLRNFGFNDWYFSSLGRPVGGFYRYGNSNPFTYFH